MFNTQFKRYFHLITKTTPNQSSIKIELYNQEKPLLSISSISTSRETLTNNSNIPYVFTKLFEVNDIEHIYGTPSFITVNVKDHLYANEYSKSITNIITEAYYTQIISEFTQPDKQFIPSNPNKQLTPYEEEINHTLDAYVRPNLINDGGNISINNYNTETCILYVILEGSCKTCSSSYITLKNNVENVVQYYHPEVKEIQEIK